MDTLKSLPQFAEVLAERGLESLRADARLTTLQVNLGKLCNQACHHCHVEAGPKRTEIMTPATVDQVLAALRRCRFEVLDITGGAPELNPSFLRLVQEGLEAGARVLVRHNLTVQFTPGQKHLPAFFRQHRVEVIASLPSFLATQTDAQRGSGVFEESIAGLRQLNAEGYGREGGELQLHLVYNPPGEELPLAQCGLERDFKQELLTRFGIHFNRLYCITNMPIRRFLDGLRRQGKEQAYMEKLIHSFNPCALRGLMCKSLVSVSWDGRLYDCDFNQMLELPVLDGCPQTISELELAPMQERAIQTGRHCFGCTAGAGSSCGGSLL